jgi:hypothetical protein
MENCLDLFDKCFIYSRNGFRGLDLDEGGEVVIEIGDYFAEL